MTPVIFTTPMVAAIRAGRKTQTRRLAMEQRNGRERRSEWARLLPGARLWIKEKWTRHHESLGGGFCYAADPLFGGFQGQFARGWKPAAWMPREAARTFLEVTDSRTERLQDITDQDACAEGITTGELGWGVPGFPGSWAETPRQAFAQLWDEIHHRHDWTENPLVAVLTFRIAPQENAT